MKNIRRVLSLFTAVPLIAISSVLSAAEMEAVDAGEETLVVVKQITGLDEAGNSRVLFEGGSGRVYRLDNIEQAVHDMNSRGIPDKGTYHGLKAVLDETVYLVDQNKVPRPAQIEATDIEQVIDLSVDNIKVTKDRITAVYTNNCRSTQM